MPAMIRAIVVLATICCARAAPLIRSKVGQSISVSSNGDMTEGKVAGSHLMRSKAGSSITSLTRSEKGSSNSATSSVDVIAEGAQAGWGGGRRRGESSTNAHRRRRRSEPSINALRDFLGEHFTNCPGAKDNLSSTYEAACDECDWLEETCVNADNITSACIKHQACANDDDPVGKYICENWGVCSGSSSSSACTDLPGFEGTGLGTSGTFGCTTSMYPGYETNGFNNMDGWCAGYGHRIKTDVAWTTTTANIACCGCGGGIVGGSSLLQRAGSSLEPNPHQAERSVAEEQDQQLDASLKKKESVDC